MGLIRESAKKIKERAAFTLAEALVAVIILLLVTTIVVAGIPAAIRAYNSVVMASNAEVLLSTSMSALRNELSTAKDIKVSSDKTSVVYFNEANASMSRIKSGESSTDIIFYRYATDEEIVKESELSEDMKKIYNKPELLISEAASDKDKKLHVKFKFIDYDDDSGIVTITGLKVTDKNGNDTAAIRGVPYSIRVITQ